MRATYNEAVVAEHITLSNAAVSLKQLQHRVSTRVDGNVTNEDFGWHCRSSCKHQQE